MWRLEMAMETAASAAVEALRTLAYDLFLLASMVEQGETAGEILH
jgi:hypothetical protein